MSAEDDEDFRLYCEGSPQERQAAARRLDERSLREGQISRADFERTWPALPPEGGGEGA